MFLLDNMHVIMKIYSDEAALWRDGCVRGSPPPMSAYSVGIRTTVVLE